MFVLAGDSFMPKNQLPIVLVNHLLKTKIEYKNLKKHESQDTLIKSN